MSLIGVCVQEVGDGFRTQKYLIIIDNSIYKNFTLDLLRNLIMTRPQTTGPTQVKLILSLSTLSTHAMIASEQDSWHLNGKEYIDGEGSQKM